MKKIIFVLILIFVSAMASADSPFPFSLSSAVSISQGIDNEYPAITIDSGNRVWVTWVGTRDHKDGIYLKSYKDGLWTNEIVVSSTTGFEYEPEICFDKQNRLWIVWSAKRNGVWSIYLRYHDTKKWSNEIKLSGSPSNEMHPAIVSDIKNGIWIAWESDEIVDNAPANSTQINFTHFTPENQIGGAIGLVGKCRRPALAMANNGDLWLAWDNYKNGNYDIYLTKISDSSSLPLLLKRGKGEVNRGFIRVTSHPAYDTAPKLAVDKKNRVWISWMSNRVGENRWNLPKWFYLRCYDGKNFYEPVLEPKGKDLTKAGPEQSFEFPNITIDAVGRIWVFGRPSQSFYAQYYEGDHWSDIQSLSNADDWGGRGEYIKSDFDSNGNLWFVRRDIRQNILQKYSGLSGKYIEPKLKKVKDESADKYLEPITPIADHKKIDKYTVYFGDLHMHSWFSDGMNLPDEIYSRARDIYHYDFATLTDHEDFVGNRIEPAEWEYLKSITNSFHQNNKFVTLCAYEWTHAAYPKGAGHKNVFFVQDDPPIFYHTMGESTVTPGLFDDLRPFGAIAIPHHIGWTGVDWENHDEEVERDFEIVSNHGAYEYMGNLPIKHRAGKEGHFIQDGLAKGLKFGLVGASDGHGLIWHHGVGRKEDSWQTGLTGVLAEEQTRESIFEALRARRCYATSGVKIFLNFKINGHCMGEEIKITDDPRITFHVEGTNILQYVYIVRDNKDIFAFGGDATTATSTYTDKNLSPGTHVYYLRVVQKDGEIAWSSPIWVTR